MLNTIKLSYTQKYLPQMTVLVLHSRKFIYISILKVQKGLLLTLEDWHSLSVVVLVLYENKTKGVTTILHHTMADLIVHDQFAKVVSNNHFYPSWFAVKSSQFTVFSANILGTIYQISVFYGMLKLPYLQATCWLTNEVHL